jgi:transketolase
MGVDLEWLERYAANRVEWGSRQAADMIRGAIAEVVELRRRPDPLRWTTEIADGAGAVLDSSAVHDSWMMPEVVQVVRLRPDFETGEVHLMVNPYKELVHEMADVEWAGPIPEPKYGP